jgi:alkanesulfonate monooxygenase SsuD/methylene tetrahydromethanopterin reductase-like flavin-dependent oxidoreductase (luciferase family)
MERCPSPCKVSKLTDVTPAGAVISPPISGTLPAVVAIALRYDLRAPSWAATRHPDLYRVCLEQCAWADREGVGDVVSLSEHHGLEDGFLPAPFTLAAAVAAVTSRLQITIAAALLPLHDPVRLAEQIAVVDLVSGGRVSFVAGTGYRRDEFSMAGIERRRAGAMLEEWIEVMRRAWTGEPFSWRGRTIRVTPTPVTKPHPLILGGGSSEGAARRAARMRVPFFPAIPDPALAAAYEDECRRVGYDGGFCVMPNAPGFVHVTEDPDRDWAIIAPYAWYDADTYRSWQAGTRSQVATRAASPEDLRREGIYWVVTPEECVERARALGPGGTIVLHPLLAGMPAELGWRSLELFRDAVLPRLRPPAGAP